MIQVVGREDYADVPLPEPIEPTVLIIRLEPMAGEICRFSYVSVKSDVADPSMLRSSEVNQRMVDLSTFRGSFLADYSPSFREKGLRAPVQ